MPAQNDVEGLSSDEDTDFDDRNEVGRTVEPLPEPAEESATPATNTDQEKEGVFEIRDFTTASSFERISHRISLAVKRWAAALEAAEAERPEDEGLQMREAFVEGGFGYELLFHLAPQTTGAGTPNDDRLGLHAFPTRAHRLQRWFGMRHFLIVSVKDDGMNLDSARTVVGAAALAVRSANQSFSLPLSCFVPVDGGRKRFLGELLDAGTRVLYTTDLQLKVDPTLEHCSGLAAFFWKKLQIDPKDPGHALMVGTRFTYSADYFHALYDDRPKVATSTADRKVENMDPVESVKLHCCWPSFPIGSFADNASYSELSPNDAPFWKVRVLRREGSPRPLTRQLQTLLGFRKEARTVLSAEHSVLPQVPKTAFESLNVAIQESLESILLPPAGDIVIMTEDCMSLPIVPVAESPGAGLALALQSLRGARAGARLSRLAQLSAGLHVFKGTVVLWCHILARMRTQWDALEKPGPDEKSPPTSRIAGRGMRTEVFESSMCLAQQKMELLQRSIEESRKSLAAPSSSSAALGSVELLSPALLTDDVLLQRDTAAANISDPLERAELNGKELRSDMSAFKAASSDACLADFLKWRSELEGLSLEVYPKEWIEELWKAVESQAASEQQLKLFQPEKEAEMALHYLENIDGSQFLLQLFCVRLKDILEDLGKTVAQASGPNHLRLLRDRAVYAAVAAFGQERGSKTTKDIQPESASQPVREAAEWPDEELVQNMLTAVEALESAKLLASSLRAKLPGQAEDLLEALLTEGEADVTLPGQRQALENLFNSSKALERARKGLDSPRRDSSVGDTPGVFDSLPLAKEFVLQLQPTGGASGIPVCSQRLYAEVRERHMRLALVRRLRVA